MARNSIKEDLKTIFLCLKTTPLAGQRVSVGRIGYFTPNKKLLMITNLNAMYIFNQSYIQFIKSWKRDHKNHLLIKCDRDILIIKKET